MTAIPNPLRWLGVARIVSGVWFISSALTIGRQFGDLQPQAARLFTGDTGTTDAPIRSFLMLVLAAVILVLGVALIVKGFRSTRRLAVPSDGPAALERDDVVGTLTRRQALAYGDGPTAPFAMLARMLPDQLADAPWWHRNDMSRGMRAFVRACCFTALVAAICVAAPSLMSDNLVGPFPTQFVIFFPFVAALWAIIPLMLIPSHGPRIESAQLSFTRRALGDQGRIVESRPKRMEQPPSAIGLTLGLVGVGVQCLLPAWWNLSTIGYPQLATSIVRHAGSIAGGVLFFALGSRMLSAAADIVMHFRYDSILVYLTDGPDQTIGYAAELRSESIGIAGPRYVTSAAANTHVSEAARELITQ